MLGLGVSVDYSLIMIRRFIDEVAEFGSRCGTHQHHANRRTDSCCLGNHGRRRSGDAADRRHAADPFDRDRRDQRRCGGRRRVSCCPSRCVVPARSSCGGLAPAVAAVHPGAVTPSLGQTCPDHHGQTGCRVGDHVCRPACPRGAGAWTADGQRRRLGSAEEFVGSSGLRSGRGAVREGRRRADTGRDRIRPIILRRRGFRSLGGDDYWIQPAGTTPHGWPRRFLSCKP